MDKRLKILAATGAILFICLVVWVISTTPKAPPQIDKVDTPNTMEYEGNTISEEKDGVKVWEITSDKVRVNSTTQVAEFERISGKFYQEDGNVLELTASNGTYDQNTGNVHIEGNVELLDSEGGRLTTKNLDWIGAEEVLVANEDVVITKDDMQAFGDRAESHDGFKHFYLKGNARVLKNVTNQQGE